MWDVPEKGYALRAAPKVNLVGPVDFVASMKKSVRVLPIASGEDGPLRLVPIPANATLALKKPIREERVVFAGQRHWSGPVPARAGGVRGR